MNVAPFDPGPKAIYWRRQKLLAKALDTNFLLLSQKFDAPAVDYRFLWESPEPHSFFNHLEFGAELQQLQDIFSDGMDCHFVMVDYSAQNLQREGICVTIRVYPKPLDWPKENR